MLCASSRHGSQTWSLDSISPRHANVTFTCAACNRNCTHVSVLWLECQCWSHWLYCGRRRHVQSAMSISYPHCLLPDNRPWKVINIWSHEGDHFIRWANRLQRPLDPRCRLMLHIRCGAGFFCFCLLWFNSIVNKIVYQILFTIMPISAFL